MFVVTENNIAELHAARAKLRKMGAVFYGEYADAITIFLDCVEGKGEVEVPHLYQIAAGLHAAWGWTDLRAQGSELYWQFVNAWEYAVEDGDRSPILPEDMLLEWEWGI